MKILPIFSMILILILSCDPEKEDVDIIKVSDETIDFVSQVCDSAGIVGLKEHDWTRVNPIIILNENGERSDWTDKVRDSWLPQKDTAVVLVLCISDEYYAYNKTCEYVNGDKVTHKIYQRQYNLYEALTGKLLESDVVSGYCLGSITNSTPSEVSAHVKFKTLECRLDIYVRADDC